MKDEGGWNLAHEEAERCRSLARFWRDRLDQLSEDWCDRDWAVAEVQNLEAEAADLDANSVDNGALH